MNNLLRAYRKMLNLTQTDMAKVAGSGLTSYNLKEQGKQDFNQTEMTSITSYIKKHIPDVTMDDIFFKENVIKLKTKRI